MRLSGLLICLFLLAACQQNSDVITIKGTVEGNQTAEQMFFQKIDENNQPYIVDTIHIQDGRFSYEFPKPAHTELGFFTFNNINANVIFFLENKNLDASIYLDSIYTSKIKGSKQNDLYNEFSRKITQFNTRRQQNMEAFQKARQDMNNNQLTTLQTEGALLANEEKVYKREFIENNKNTLLAMMMLSEMVVREEIPSADAQKIVDGTDQHLQENSIVVQMKKTLNEKRIAAVGSIAPNFTGPTPEGDMLSLNDVLGKVTLIDFWASWCRPCRVENPNVVRVYNQYKDKGFSIISVSLDRPGQKNQWIKAIEDDRMDWHHVSNLQFWNDPIARQYGIKSIPATYILDENGKILAKDLRGPALGQKVGELLDGENAL